MQCSTPYPELNAVLAKFVAEARAILAENFCVRPSSTAPSRQDAVVNTAHDIGVAARIGKYSDAVSVAPGAHWLALSGTPGLTADGTIPDGFDEEAAQAWTNVCAALDAAGFTVPDLVKITQYLTSADNIAAHATIRARFLGDARPASMLVVVPALVWPQMRIEIEAWAARSG